MAGYRPLNIKANETGLVQSREEFILPNDAYPNLQNAFIFRERIKKKQGATYLGRLLRLLPGAFIGNTMASPWTFNIFANLGLSSGEPNAQLQAIAPVINGPIGFFDNGNGILTSNVPGNSGTVNYATGQITLIHTAGVGIATFSQVNYYPSLPVMGICLLESPRSANKGTIFFDTTYAYTYNNGFSEFIPGKTWNAAGLSPTNNTNFVWSTNYWQDGALDANPLIWVTNYSGRNGDPIRYTNSQAWIDFSPQIDNSGNFLQQCQGILPFRGRLLVFNTLEGPTLANSTNYRQRIRWAAIGNPITVVSSIISTFNATAWRSDIRGQGGFLDIPTTDAIVSAGFVRDNMVIFCENSTWQLRYTGRSIQPFQIERVNSELGSRNTFSSVQFDTSLVSMGNKAIVECDSFKSSPIDIKIPDFVFNLNSSTPNPVFEHGPNRIWGQRDFEQRIAYWIYPSSIVNGVFPDSRLVYNYENDSWAIFNDSYTSLGSFQQVNNRSWQDPEGNGNFNEWSWQESNFQWGNQPSLFPSLVAGNQQGYVLILDQKTDNDKSLSIYGITGNAPNATSINSINHNLQTGQIIQIINIPIGTPFANLNGGIFYVQVTDANNFTLFIYDSASQGFDLPQSDASGQVYVGLGEILIRDNFSIKSKKFNFMDDGQNIQIGYIDVLTNVTSVGEFSLNMYIDYNDAEPVNTLDNNAKSGSGNPLAPDTFFNSIIPTSAAALNTTEGTKAWQRVYCATRGNFITIEYAFSNAQMAGINFNATGDPVANDIQIDAQIIWQRASGRMAQF